MKVLLREATNDDRELMMAWRSNPILFKTGAYTQKAPLTWNEHYTWWNTRGPWWKFFIIQVNDGITTHDVGVVNFGQLDNWNPEFNYYLGEVSLWSQGVGEQALQLGINWLREHGYCRLHTTIVDDNKRSEGVLRKLGFKRIRAARKGESYWEMKLSDEVGSTEYTSGRKSL